MSNVETGKQAGRALGCVIALLVAFFLGCMGCAFGGVMMAVAGDTTFGIAAPFVCGGDEVVEVDCHSRSYHEPGECEPEITCISPSGVEEDVTPQALLIVMLLFFAIVFVPVALILGIFAWILPGKIAASFRKGRGSKSQADPTG